MNDTKPQVTTTASSSRLSRDKSSESSKKYKTPLSNKQISQRLTLTTPDKWIKRVLAPYVPVSTKGYKVTLRRDVNYYNFFLTKKSDLLMRSMRNYIANKKDLPALLHETADVLKSLTDSLGARLYLTDYTKNHLYQYQKNVTYPRCRVNYDLNTCQSVACYVARSKEFVMVNDVNKDARFPDGVSYKDNVKSVLCLPIVTHLATFAVIELYRDVAQAAYKKNDLKVAVLLCGWIGLTIQENQDGYLLHQKQTIDSTLLQMVLSYYSHPETLESLLSEILNFAKKEISAEKGTFYVIRNAETMVADVYEEGISDYNKFLVKKKQAVHFGRDNTVANLVAKEKQTINVKDLFSDPRFKTQVEMDEELLIIERTELCVPIITNETLLGIISLVNKTDESYFTPEDEQILSVISTYAGLALFYAQGRSEIKKTQRNLECAYDLLQYHLKPCPLELENLQNSEYSFPKNIYDFSYYISPDDLPAMPHYYIKMVRDIIPDEEINFTELHAFVLTAQRSYRNNPYHNFEHAFNVSHGMFTILFRNLTKFSLIEREALMIAALTHDIDHGGVTNNFLLLTNHRLSAIYEDSIWENHHCFVTEQLLRKYNIFKNVNADTRTAFMKQVHENIMFTDMVYYFKNRTKLVPIINNTGEFDFHDELHKYYLRSVCMTMADLSGQAKPFSVTKRLTDALYREFFAQGDTEKEMGFTPLAMMDRDTESHIPEDQSQFLTIAVMSAADLLRNILPNTEDLYFNAEMSRDTWRRILESRGDKLWRQCDSVVS